MKRKYLSAAQKRRKKSEDLEEAVRNTTSITAFCTAAVTGHPSNSDIEEHNKIKSTSSNILCDQIVNSDVQPVCVQPQETIGESHDKPSPRSEIIERECTDQIPLFNYDLENPSDRGHFPSHRTIWKYYLSLMDPVNQLVHLKKTKKM